MTLLIGFCAVVGVVGLGSFAALLLWSVFGD